MTELTPEAIRIIGNINKVVEDSKFYVNHFVVGNTGTGKLMIELDIREKE